MSLTTYAPSIPKLVSLAFIVLLVGRENTSVLSNYNQCSFATNGAPFNIMAPHCAGVVVSDGKIVMTNFSDSAGNFML